MKTVVVYESMYGNTHLAAEAIADGLRSLGDVAIGSVSEIEPQSVADADLVVVGGPTHVHGMSRASSRKAAAEAAGQDEDIDLEPDAAGPGLRDWFRDAPKAPGVWGAAFDTRIHKSAFLTGSAAKGIAKQLRAHRVESLAEPESFFVEGSEGPLETGEADRARAWGTGLADRCRELGLT